MSTREAFIAVNRFGLGARPGELRSAAADPAGWVERQLASQADVPSALSGFPGSRDTILQFQAARKAAKKSKDKSGVKMLRKKYRQAYLDEAAARTQTQIDTTQPVTERLVAFWSNHFTVSVRKPLLRGAAGAFEREAIRPHVTGRFTDMLRAVVRHPAMLVYLDNAQSIGPNSKAGRRRKRGLNENLAREILELHTLGVDGGYTQTDVREFAKILTGWSVAGGRVQSPDGFTFRKAAHEPGPKMLLGRRFTEAGVREGEDALDMLARHPSTARHVATKLVRHFAADVPPERLVKHLAQVFLDTDGDLRAVMGALVRAPEVWAAPLPKVKTPNEFVVSVLRATGYRDAPKKLIGALRLLGQLPYAAPSPAGWPDEAAKWVGPAAMMQRAEFSMALGRRLKGKLAADALLAETIAPVVSEATKLAVARAPTRAEAIATVFASPEFQRR